MTETTETPQRVTSAVDMLRRYAAGERGFRDADLSDADLSDADLSDADLRDANLRDANLRDAKKHPIEQP